MADGAGAVHQAALLKVLDDQGVGLLHEHAGERLDLRPEISVQVDHVANRDALPLAELEVVDAVGRRRVNDPGAVLDGYEVGIDHVERRLIRHQVSVEGLVALSEQGLARELCLDLIVAFQDGQPGLGQDVSLLALADPDVGNVQPDGQRDVAGQRPGSGGPGQEERPGLVFELELDVHGRVFDVVLVPTRQPQLVARQRGRVVRTVGHHLESLVEKLLVPERLENPPDALHVGGIECPVGMLQIDPIPHPVGELCPLTDVLEDALPASLVELLDAVPLDVLLA